MTPSVAMPTLTAAAPNLVGPKLLHKVQPTYPATAAVSRVYGTVVLNVTVSETGRVTKIEVVSGDPRLTPAARSAVAMWRYQPAELDGKPVPAVVPVVINFRSPSGGR